MARCIAAVAVPRSQASRSNKPSLNSHIFHAGFSNHSTSPNAHRASILLNRARKLVKLLVPHSQPQAQESSQALSKHEEM